KFRIALLSDEDARAPRARAVVPIAEARVIFHGREEPLLRVCPVDDDHPAVLIRRKLDQSAAVLVDDPQRLARDVLEELDWTVIWWRSLILPPRRADADGGQGDQACRNR